MPYDFNPSGRKILFPMIIRLNLQKPLGSLKGQWSLSFFSRKKEDVLIFKYQPAPLQGNDLSAL